MNIISRIKQIKPIFDINTNTRTITATTIFNGIIYRAQARCALEDKEFFSERVGKRIARMKIYLLILDAERARVKEEWLSKQRYYKEVLAFGEKNPAEIDPSSAFKRNLERAAARYKKLDTTYKIVAQNLKDYLTGLQKSHAIVRDYRDRLAKNG